VFERIQYVGTFGFLLPSLVIKQSQKCQHTESDQTSLQGAHLTVEKIGHFAFLTPSG